MSEYGNLKAERPVRFVLAVFVFRAMWWPVVAILMPFVVVGAIIDWLSWTASPAVARTFQPVGSALYKGALASGNAILGYHPKDDAR